MVGLTAGNYVDKMQERHNCRLSALERSAYVQATTIVMKTTQACDFKDLHGILMSHDPVVAGKYRESDVLDSYTCEVKKFPRPTSITQLIGDVWQEYEQMLGEKSSDLSTIELKLEIWRIAAKLRCIRPFRKGSARLSFLLQGQMNTAQGFDFLCKEFDIETFRRYREWYQAENSQFYGRSRGAI